MRLLLSNICFCISLVLSAQEGFKTRYYPSNTLTSNTKAIFETTPGNYIGCGYLFDTLNGLNTNRIAMIGLNSQGQIQWLKKYGNYKLEYLNNQFIQRTFRRLGNFIYLATCVRDSNNKQIGCFIKFNLNGDTLWQRFYRDTAEDVIPQMVTSCLDGGFLITGFFEGASRRCMLIKTSANGNELWRKKISKPAPNISDGQTILQDSASKKIVIGGYQNLGSNNIYDNMLVLDSLGNWIAQGNYCVFGGLAKDMIQTRDHKFIVVGYQYYPQSLGGNYLTKAYAVKFDINDPYNPIWKINGYGKLALYNGFFCLKELSNGDVMIAGSLDSVHGVINGPLNAIENELIRFTKIDSNGNIIWNRFYNYKTNDSADFNSQGVMALELSSDGGWIAAIEGFNIPNPNPFFFVKYDSTGCDSSAAYCATVNLVGLQSVKIRNTNVHIYPNPANRTLFIESMLFDEDSELILTDILGRQVLQINITQKNSIDISALQEGVYFLSLLKNKEVVYKTKIIKEE